MFQIIWALNDILHETSLETTIIIVVTILLLSYLIRNLLDIPLLDNIPGRYILITGCDSGFGYHLALKLDSLGCNVIATCLTEDGANKLKEASSRIASPIMDVRDHDSVVRVKTIVEELLSKQNKGIFNSQGFS